MLGFGALGQFPLGAFQQSIAAAARLGPADDRKARRQRDDALMYAYWRRQREEEAEAKRKADALAEAEAALERAEAAKRADTRRKAVRKVFAALKVANEEQAVRQAAAQASLAQAREAVAHVQAIMAAEFERLKRQRAEEEEFVLLQLWAA